jgi:hypothetical protein
MKRIIDLVCMGVLVLTNLSVLNAQTINITGTVVDNGTAQGIANAKVALIEVPACTTRTDANGAFTLGGVTAVRGFGISLPHNVAPVSMAAIRLSGNRLTVETQKNSAPIMVDAFTVLGQRVFHAEKPALGSAEFGALWQTPGLYYVKVRIGSEEHILSSFGSKTWANRKTSVDSGEKGLKKAAAVYTIEAGASGYDSKQTAMTGVAGSAGTIRLSTYAQQPGTWKNVTPHALDSALRAGKSWGGVQYALGDPVRHSDLWASADCQGTWKSTDYGLTWTHINTGTNGAAVNGGRQWSQAIDLNPNRDPATSPTIYTTLGYGTGNIWKSTDDGVNWTNIWNNNQYASDGVTNISSDLGGDMARVQVVDKSGPDHLIAYLHSYWGTGGNNGLFESTDGGGKWIDHKAQTFNFQPHADGGYAFDATTWAVLHGTTWPNNVLYRTTDGGSTWGTAASNLAMSTSNSANPLTIGVVSYLAGSPLLKTTDKGATWTPISAAGNCGSALCATATKHIYISTGSDANFKVRHASVGNDASWTDDPVPNPADLYWGSSSTAYNATPNVFVATYDGTHAIIVSANWEGGIWRYVEP